MRALYYGRLVFPVSTCVGLVIFALLFVGFSGSALAEGYVAGFGGLSMPSSLSDAKMDTYGERLALQQFPGAAPPATTGTLTQTFNTSDIGLKNSPRFGGKAGYFFKE